MARQGDNEAVLCRVIAPGFKGATAARRLLVAELLSRTEDPDFRERVRADPKVLRTRLTGALTGPIIVRNGPQLRAADDGGKDTQNREAAKDQHANGRTAEGEKPAELKLPEERIDDLEPEASESGNVTGGGNNKWGEITL
jgi:hypothetical protein